MCMTGDMRREVWNWELRSGKWKGSWNFEMTPAAGSVQFFSFAIF